jgi:hypothetical protein
MANLAKRQVSQLRQTCQTSWLKPATQVKPRQLLNVRQHAGPDCFAPIIPMASFPTVALKLQLQLL